MSSVAEEEGEIDSSNVSMANDSEQMRRQISRTFFERREMDLFLRWPEFKHWRGFVRFSNDSPTAQFV